MTDAQRIAYEKSRENLTATQTRILAVIVNRPGSTLDDIRAGYQAAYGRPLPEKTASGRVSELAKMGIIYVNGTRKIGTRTLSRYYYEPDPECRFRIREQREAEDYLRWLRRGTRFADRLPGHVRGWLDHQKYLLEEPEKTEA